MTAKKESTKTTPALEHILLCVLALALPVVLASGFTSYEVVKAVVLHVVGCGLLMSLGVRAMRGERVWFVAPAVLFAFGGFAGFALLSALWSLDRPGSLFASGVWVAMCGVLASLLSSKGKGLSASWVVGALSLGVIGASVVGLLQSFGIVLDAAAPTSLADGIRGAFDYEQTAAFSLVCALPFLVAGIASSRSALWVRILGSVAVLFAAVYIGATGTMDALLALVLGVLVTTGIFVFTRGAGSLAGFLSKPLVGVLVACAVIFAGSMAADSGVFTNGAKRLEGVKKLAGIDYDNNVVGIGYADWGRDVVPRGEEAYDFALQSGWNMFQSHKGVGVGSGAFDQYVMGYMETRQSGYYKKNKDADPSFRSAHNGYVQLFAELGLVGFLLFSLGLVLALVLILRGLHKENSKDERHTDDDLMISWGASSSAATVLLASAFGTVLHTAFGAFVLALGLGIALRHTMDRVQNTGIARTWKVGESGFGGVERFVLLGAASFVVCGFVLGGTWFAAASDFYKARGDVWLRAGFMQKAQEAYADALSVSPSADLASFNHAHIMVLSAPRPEAEKALLEAIALRPNDARLFTSLGDIQTRISLLLGGEKIQGRDKEKQVKEGDAESLAKMMQEYDLAALKKSRMSLERAIEIHPKMSEPYRLLSNTYLIERNTKEARKPLKALIDQYAVSEIDDPTTIYTALGKLSASDKAWDDSVKYLKVALSLTASGPKQTNLRHELERVEAMRDGKPLPSAHDHGSHDDHGGHGGHGGKPPGMPGGIPGMPGGMPGMPGGMPPNGGRRADPMQKLKDEVMRKMRKGQKAPEEKKGHDHGHDHDHDHDHDHSHGHDKKDMKKAP